MTSVSFCVLRRFISKVKSMVTAHKVSIGYALQSNNTHSSSADLVNDPYPILRRVRAEQPVSKITAVKRTVQTKTAATKQC